MVEHLLRGCPGRGQQGAPKGRDVAGLWVLWWSKERRAPFITGKDVQFCGRSRVACRDNLEKGALQLGALFSSHHQFSDGFAALYVLGAIPAHLALLWLFGASDGSEAIVGIAFRMFNFFGGGLVAPNLLFRVGETVPAVGDDASNVAVIVFNVGADLLGSGKGGTEQHERVPWTGDVVGVFVAWGGAGGGDGHGSEGGRGGEGEGEGVRFDGGGRGGGRGAHDDLVEEGPLIWDERVIEGGIKGEHDGGKCDPLILSTRFISAPSPRHTEQAYIPHLEGHLFLKSRRLLHLVCDNNSLGRSRPHVARHFPCDITPAAAPP